MKNILCLFTGPGAIVAIRNPSKIREYMGDTPILPVEKWMIPVSPVLQWPEKNVVSSSQRLQGFYITGAQLELDGGNFISSNCNGHFCDQQGAHVNGREQERCACFQNSGSRRIAVFSCNIMVTSRAGFTFSADYFTSRHFYKTYAFETAIPTTTSASELNNNFAIEEAASDCVHGVFEYVNNNGGWDVDGWAKPGLILDQATAPAQGANPFQAAPMQQEYFNTGNINYHIVSMVPSSPAQLNLITMNAFKIDIAALLREN